jgi:hypothetical protein
MKIAPEYFFISSQRRIWKLTWGQLLSFDLTPNPAPRVSVRQVADVSTAAIALTDIKQTVLSLYFI